MTVLAEPNVTLSDAARRLKDALKDRSYRATPLGLQVARYYRWKKNEWGATPETLRDYEAILAKLALFHADLEISDLEPPDGVERLREFWDHHWGQREARTRAKTLSVMRDFNSWAAREGLVKGNAAALITSPKRRKPERHAMSRDLVGQIIEGQGKLHNKLACRLIMQYGLRRAEVASVQLKHFDFDRRKLFVKGKGGRIRYVPLGDPMFWRELGQLQLERQWHPDEFLLFPQKRRGTKVIQENRKVGYVPRSIHNWWYRCLEEARVVDKGVQSGVNMHRGRHTAGQALLDHTHGNLKAVQKFLGHADIATTGDTYVDWDDAQLHESVASMYDQEG
jgi:site-specific recombinase XerC